MTLEEFRATRRRIDGSKAAEFAMEQYYEFGEFVQALYVYDDHLFIDILADGSHALLIGNMYYDGLPLEELEEVLYRYSRDENDDPCPNGPC